jgi:hypothetical protein
MSEVKQVLELNGMDGLRLLSAFQALTMPSRFYRVTHKEARDIIEEITGKRPKGKPVKQSGESALEGYLSWHFGGVVVEMKDREPRGKLD